MSHPAKTAATQRRDFLKATAAGLGTTAALALPGCATMGAG